MDVNKIYHYWNEKAEKLKADPCATMKDVVLRSLEIEAIATRLQRNDVLVDVGAGNGFGSLEWAKRCRNVLATDYSPKMVGAARNAIAESRYTNIQAEVANVLDLGSYEDRFSAVSCVRCLINLPSEKDQYLALRQLARPLCRGGRLFLIEGLTGTFTAMNEMREKVGLAAIKLHWHNRLLARDKLEKALNELFVIEECVDFGVYYFLSRIVHPLLVAPEEPRFDDRPNFVAANIWRCGVAQGVFAFMSTLMLYVCRRNNK
ncbi:MAG: class I SAM-dependent methyltransferase [Planctomycetota bacterium]|jgi:ubiquinone/menaquinone biosynthesis C-methylase UbiE